MTGQGVIVMRLKGGVSDGGHVYREHASVDLAKREAHRLAASQGGTFVVYLPVCIVEPAPRTVEAAVVLPPAADVHRVTGKPLEF